MEMHLLWRLAVNLTFGDRNAMEDRQCFRLHPVGQGTSGNEFLDLGIVAAVAMFWLCLFLVLSMRVMMFVMLVMMMGVMRVSMGVCCPIRVPVLMDVFFLGMLVIIAMIVFVMMLVLVCEMYVELHPFNACFCSASNMQVISIEL